MFLSLYLKIGIGGLLEYRPYFTISPRAPCEPIHVAICGDVTTAFSQRVSPLPMPDTRSTAVDQAAPDEGSASSGPAQTGATQGLLEVIQKGSALLVRSSPAASVAL